MKDEVQKPDMEIMPAHPERFLLPEAQFRNLSPAACEFLGNDTVYIKGFGETVIPISSSISGQADNFLTGDFYWLDKRCGVAPYRARLNDGGLVTQFIRLGKQVIGAFIFYPPQHGERFGYNKVLSIADLPKDEEQDLIAIAARYKERLELMFGYKYVEDPKPAGTFTLEDLRSDSSNSLQDY